MRKILLILAMSLSISALSQVINCPSGFTTSGTGACSVSNSPATDDFWTNNSPAALSGSAMILTATGSGHNGWSFIRQSKVNVQAFTATWTFVMNGMNHAFVIQNDSTQSGQTLSAGAGQEGGFSQMAGGGNIAPNNTFAIMLDSYGALTQSGSFTYSSAQWYETLQSPFNPPFSGYLPYFTITKLSTSPVPLNSPSSTRFTTTGDTYSATVTYDGYTLTLNMFDVTASGSCPGASCYSKSWTGVYIPSIVGATTAWVGFTSGTDGSSIPTNNLDINTFTYTVNTPTGSPSFTAWNANSTYNTGVSSAASPVYSVLPGPYSSTQSVAITTSTSPHNYICYALSATPLTPASSALYPRPDNNGGCSAGTLYTGAVSVSSTSTLYAMAGSNNSAFTVGSQNPTGLGPPSTLVAGTYTISSTIINVNSSMSEATIQGLINGGTAGDTVVFAPGTYNLASNGGNPNSAALNLKAGLSYTGPTSGSPAILTGTGLYPLMYFGSTTVSILHFTFNNGFIFFDDHTTGATVDNNVFTNMPVCNTTASQTSAIYVAGGINNSDISFNTFSHIGDNCNTVPNDASGGAGGIVFFAFHALTITHNTFDNVREAMDIPISTGGSYDCAGGDFEFNTFTNIVRIGIELLGSSTKPSGLIVANNSFTLPLNPYFASFGYSLTAGQNMVFHDNGANSNSVSGGTGPYAVEIAGNGTQAYNNTIQGAWALGFAIGNTGGAISIINNVICGPNMNANPSSGSTPSVGNSNGFIGWEGPSQGGTFTGNTTSAASTCGSSTVATPTFSLTAGTYTGTQSVAISTLTSGASVVYTNDGSTPTVTASTCTITHGTLYAGPVSVPTSQTLKAIGCLASNTASAVASAAYVINVVTLTANVPPYGFQVMTGAVRTVPVFPSGAGATTKKINWSATGATLSCSTNCPAVVTVTITAAGGTCSVTGSVGSYVLHSTSDVILTAQSVDDLSKTVTIPFHVCDTTASAFVDVEPSYNQAYQGQQKTLQSYVIGYTNEQVTWAITTAPGGGNATLSDTGNRDVVFNSGTVTGRYVLTATSVANGSITGTAIVYVSPNSLPAYSATHGRTPNKTEPTECYVDPAFAHDYEVGAGQTYPDLTTVPFLTWTASSIVRIHPGTYANWIAVQGTGTPTSPLYICGIADSSGNLPIIDGNNATTNLSNPTVLNGLGGFAMIGTNSGIGQGYSLGSIGPDYLSITGLEITNFNVPYQYHAAPSGTLTSYGSTGNGASGVWVGSGQHVHMEGLHLKNDDWGVLANNNTSGTGRRFTRFHQFIGGHIENFAEPGTYSNHALYLEALDSLVEGNLIENPNSTLTGTSPNYSNGDYIKMRGGDSIIRYNLFRGLLTDHVIEYPDMEDTWQFVGVDMNLGVPSDTTCADSVWCTLPSTNITLNQLTENAEALAKDFLYGNTMANQMPIVDVQDGSQSAPVECAPCTNMADRQGTLKFWNNTDVFSAQALSFINYNSGGFVATNPIFSQISGFAANNAFWSDPTFQHSFSVNYDGTAVISFLTNMYTSGVMNITTPITGGPSTGFGNFVNTISWPGTSPLNAHMTGISSGNFLSTGTIPFNPFTFAPISGSPLIGAGTATPVTGMLCRFQPDPEWGYMTARTDNCTTIGSMQSGTQPTVASVTLSPASSVYAVPPPTTVQTYLALLTSSSAQIPAQQIQFNACGWSSSNTVSMQFFGTCSSNGQVFTGAVAGSGNVGMTYPGFTPITPFTVGSGPAVVASPTMVPPGNTYSGTQSVVISSATAGSSTVYTNDGSTPTVTSSTCTITHGTLYVSPVSVSSSQTLKAIGCKSGATASGVTTAAYTILPATPINFSGQLSGSSAHVP